MQLSRWFLIGMTTALTALVGCADPVEDINRVQPHYQEKTNFVGQWYYRQTIVDVPPHMTYGFTGIEGALEKIRWEIRESELIAYRIHESIPGLDRNDNREGADYQGSPVAVFKINEHFDIIRDFNRQTGEQRNVLVEDQSLKPWYDREFMRIDWTSNKAPGPVDFTKSFSNSGAVVNTRWIRETEITNPDRLQVEPGYLFLTSYASLSDGLYGCRGLHQLGWSTGCVGGELKLRHAFVKIDQEDAEQFEARPYLDRDLIKTTAESFTDTNGNGRYDGPEHFEDANDSGNYDSGEDFVDRDRDGKWNGAEPFDDTNQNGRWDTEVGIKYVTLSAGTEGETQVQVACTPEVLNANPEISERDCRELQFDQFGRFGYFRSERTGYDDRIGSGHDVNREFYANHHQIWKRTKDKDGQHIDPTQRDLRPVIYYLNPNFPDDLRTTAVKIGRDWNNAFIESAMVATGRSRTEIEAQLSDDFADSGELAVFMKGDDGETFGSEALFQVRDNNCSVAGIESYVADNPSMQATIDDATAGKGLLPGTLLPACSAVAYQSRKDGLETPFTWQQMGDPRFSYIWLVNESQPGGPLGYGPSSADIENGRIISGNAYVYGAAVDSYARAAADIVRMMNGDLCSDEEQRGDYQNLECLLDGRSYDEWAARGTSVADMDLEISPEFSDEMRRRMGSTTLKGLHKLQRPDGSMDTAKVARHMAQRLQRMDSDDPLWGNFSAPAGEGQQRIEALKENPEIRSRLVTNEMLQLIGPMFDWTPGEPVPVEMEDLAVDLAIDPGALDKLNQDRQRFFAEKNVYLSDHIDDSVVGQALSMKGMDPEEVYHQLRREIFEGVMLHEIGHTVGLRHNFRASFDALNYQDDFWEIRDRFEPEEWTEQRLHEHRYASIMDYGSRFNSDTKGLGKYDYAAIKFVYANHVEVFGEDVSVPGRFDLELEFNDYSKIPEMLGGDISSLTNRADKPLSTLIDEKRAGVLENAKLYAENPERSSADFWIDHTVPYGFCEDFYRGDLKCRTWDEGANITESVQAGIRNYWNYYFFNAFRRGRNAGSFINSYFSRQARVREFLVDPFKFYSFYDGYDVDIREDLLQASVIGFNFINQVLGTPETGHYCKSGNTYYPTWLGQDPSTCDLIKVPWGVGRDMYLNFDEQYIYEIDYLGLYYDKSNLFANLVDVSSRFFRVSDQTDNRVFSIGYYQAFKPELVGLVRDMVLTSLSGFITNNTIVLEPIPGNVYESLVVDGEVVPQLLVDPSGARTERDLESDRIYSSVPYNLAWRAILLSTAWNTNRWDGKTDFAHYIHISEEGSGDDQQIADEVETTQFVHPMTGQAYRAQRIPGEISISYDLLERASAYAETWKLRRRRMANSNEAGLEAAQRSFKEADERLQNMVEFMDDMRQIQSLFDWAN